MRGNLGANMSIDRESTAAVEAGILAEMNFEDYPKNHVLVGKGVKAYGLLVVRQGLAGLYRSSPDGEENLIAPFLPGMFAGSHLERGLADELTLRTIAPARVGRIPEDRLRAMMAERRYALWASTSQFRNKTVLVAFLSSASQRTTDRKILNFVQAYLEHALGRPLGSAEKAEWLITQSHLSEILGVTRTHLNARLSALSERGILDIRRRTVYWRQPDAAHGTPLYPENGLAAS